MLSNATITRPDTTRRTVALVALSLAFALVQLDATIVNVALPDLRDALGGDLGDAQWAVVGYAVPFAALMLAAGSAADRSGHRRACVAGFALFAVASVAAALARDWPLLISARAVQGAGAALLLPASLAMIPSLYPDLRERSRALGVWGGIATLGFAAGPAVGGWLVTQYGWPAIFWINVPVCVVLAAAIAVVAPADEPGTHTVPLGAAALGVLGLAGLTGAVIGIGQGRSGLAAALAVAGLGAGAAFVLVERRARQPLMPRGLVASVPFRWDLVTGFAFNLVMYGSLLCVSLTLQDAFGFSALDGGLAVLPMAAVVMVGATTSGHLAARIGPRRPMLAGFGCGAAGSVVTAIGAALGSPATLVVGLTMTGLLSLAMPAMTAVALQVAPAAHRGTAGGALNTARQIGGAVGVALLGAILNLGGAQTGMVVACVVSALTCIGALASTVLATADATGAGRAG